MAKPPLPPRFTRRTREGRHALIAYHEAAHAVAFTVLGDSVERVEIGRVGESLGRTRVHAHIVDAVVAGAIVDLPRPLYLTALEQGTVALLAGWVAEFRCRGQACDVADRRYADRACKWIDGHS